MRWAKSAISILFSAYLRYSEAMWIAYRKSEGRQAFPLQPSKYSPCWEGQEQFLCSGPSLNGVKQSVTLDRRQCRMWAFAAIGISHRTI